MNLNEPITVRQLISFVMTPDETAPRNKNWMSKQLFRYIHLKDSQFVCERKKTLKEISTTYQKVVDELLSKRKTKSYDMSIVVRDCEYAERLEVVLKNPNYVAPAEGLKPWGGENYPKGYYNCNDEKHNQYFAFGSVPWSKLIDTNIYVETLDLAIWEVLGEILLEMTFDGLSEKECNRNQKKLKKLLDERIKEIDRGETVELSRSKDGKLKVIAAKSFLEDLKKTTNKNRKI